MNHGQYAGYRAGCRCDDCRNAASRRRRTWKSYRKQPITPAPCGTNAAYKRGCRCDDCRNARAEASRQWPSSGKNRGIVEARNRVDHANVQAFVDGLIPWQDATPAERKIAARILDSRGVSRNEISRRTRLNSDTLWRELRRKDDDDMGHNPHDPFARLYVTPPPAEPRCTGRPDLFVDWLSTPGVMRNGHPTEWAQPYIRGALQICAQCPVQRWCVDVATVPHRSGVTIIAGGKLWVKGRVVWDVARQEAWEAAQDYEAAS
jgi:hypothetical protein